MNHPKRRPRRHRWLAAAALLISACGAENVLIPVGQSLPSRPAYSSGGGSCDQDCRLRVAQMALQYQLQQEQLQQQQILFNRYQLMQMQRPYGY